MSETLSELTIKLRKNKIQKHIVILRQDVISGVSTCDKVRNTLLY